MTGTSAGSGKDPKRPPHKRFLESEIAQPDPAEAAFHVIPVPYERTVSYGGGTAGGPEAIIAASNQLEVFDGHSVPAEAGIYTYAAINCSGSRQTVFARISAACAEAAGAGAVPVVLGGEHSISFPAVEGVRRALGGIPLGVVQFDAHADLRREYEGDPYSHASVMHRIVDAGCPVVQLGVRALSPGEVLLRRSLVEAHRLRHHDAEELVTRRVSRLALPDWLPQWIYITIDLDALDPSIIPATGTPEPGGLEWYQTLALLESVAAQRRVVGLDVVELAPAFGLHMAEFAAARLTYQAIGCVHRAGTRHDGTPPT